MKNIPIVSHHSPKCSVMMMAKVDRMAERLLARHSQFAVPQRLQSLIPGSLHPAAAIHIDDYSAIRRTSVEDDFSFYQHRARLRAGDGDVLVTSLTPAEGYEDYCSATLGLGDVDWLTVPGESQGRVVERAWADREIRRDLIQRLRHGDVEYLHPHMGTQPVWELAAMLHHSSRRPIKVIAPLPALMRWTNDKVAFAQTVAHLFGDQSVPESSAAWNQSTLVPRLQAMAEHCDYVGVKLPDSVGGDGNLVFDTVEIRHQSPRRILELLRQRMPGPWTIDSPILIDEWATDVLCSPSVQTWIPPVADGLPVVEGVFVQDTEGINGVFVGNQPAEFPRILTEEIADKTWLIARLFQRLGYVGRCSMDLILVGQELGNCHVEFIECNGRWGGTSLPMTLMNRLFGDWSAQPYAVRVVAMQELKCVSFAELLVSLKASLYDRHSGFGDLILYNPRRLQALSEVDVIALGDTWKAAGDAVVELQGRIAHLLQSNPTSSGTA